MACLDSARFKLVLKNKKANEWKAQWGSNVLDKIAECIKKLQVFRDPVDVAPFEGVEGIDAGEATMFAAGASNANLRVATGDKRSLIALATATSCKSMADKLRGRVICFEQIIKSLIHKHGFEYVKQRIVPVTSCDKALDCAFGSGLQSIEQNVVDALDSYIVDLQLKSLGLLVGDNLAATPRVEAQHGSKGTAAYSGMAASPSDG